MSDTIRNLCREYTDLFEEEIDEIVKAAEHLDVFASMLDADAFIDCPLRDGSGDAIVVAEAKSIATPSAYKESVVGMIATKEKEPAVNRTFELGIPVKFVKAITQEDQTVIQRVEPIFSMNRVIGVYIIEEKCEQYDFPITTYRDDKEIENVGDDLRVVDTLDEALIFINSEGYVAYCNKAAEKIYDKLGFVMKIIGSRYESICLMKEDEDDKKQMIVKKEVRIGNRYLRIKRTKVDHDGLDFLINILDITDEKKREKELIFKSVAIQEMHHRIKNNLQTIVSLLRLQKNKIESEDAKAIIDDTVNRIMVIAGTHEILMQNDDESPKLNNLINNIKNNMLQSYHRDDFDLNIECHGGDFKESMDRAVAVAFVLSELIQNSLKHAFKGRSEGSIFIMSLKKSDGMTEIVYKDNGCGFDVEEARSKKSMGWTIVDLMVKEKLRGHITITSGSEGTRIKIIF